MTKLTRRRVVAAKLETTKGTYSSPDATNAKFHVIDPQFTINPPRFERNIVQSSLTRLAPQTGGGIAAVEITFSVELAGHPDNIGSSSDFTSPEFSNLLRACGMTDQQVWVLDISGQTVTGTFQHLESVTQATSNATGTVIGDVNPGQDYMVLRAVTSTGFTVGPTITGDTSGATVNGHGSGGTISSSSQSKRAWFFDSDPDTNNTISIDVYADGKKLAAKGCRGSFTMSGSFGDRVLMNFTFVGVLHGYTDTALITPTRAQELPPAFRNIGMMFRTGSDDAAAAADFNISEFGVDMQADVVVRENAQGSAGYSFAIISSRSLSLTMNPDELDNSDFDFQDALVNGTEIYGNAQVGSTAGNTFFLTWGAAVPASLGDSDRDGVHAWDGTFDLVGSNYSTGDAGSESEFVMVYL